jgi:hypothetical protein
MKTLLLAILLVTGLAHAQEAEDAKHFNIDTDFVIHRFETLLSAMMAADEETLKILVAPVLSANIGDGQTLVSQDDFIEALKNAAADLKSNSFTVDRNSVKWELKHHAKDDGSYYCALQVTLAYSGHIVLQSGKEINQRIKVVWWALFNEKYFGGVVTGIAFDPEEEAKTQI